MKQVTLLSLLAIVLLSAFTFVDEPNPLMGKWENYRTYQGSPWVLTADFKSNGTFTGAINKKLFSTGHYTVKHDTLSIYEPGCNINYAGTYKIQFYGQDSLRFHVIKDTCGGRREGTDNFLFKKVKSAK